MAKSKYCFTKVPHLTDDGHDTNQWRMALVMENIPGYSFGNTTAKPIIGSAEYVDKIVDLYLDGKINSPLPSLKKITL